MKILLIVQDDPRFGPEFSGRLIDGMRSNGCDVLPYAQLVYAKASILSRTASSDERNMARTCRDQIRSCDALMFIQSALILPGDSLEYLIMMMRWFVSHHRPVIVAVGHDLEVDWPANEVDYAFDWERDVDLHGFVASQDFGDALSFLQSDLAAGFPSHDA